MSPYAIALIQLGLPLLLGLAMTLFLRQALYRLLCDLCQTADRARFWERIIGVLMLIAPLALVLWFGSTEPASALHLMRQTVALSLVGMVLALGMVAWQMGRYIPRLAPGSHHAASVAPRAPEPAEAALWQE